MGADCGCGGTCSICASIAGRDMLSHALEINQAVKSLGEKPTDVKDAKEENKEKEE